MSAGRSRERESHRMAAGFGRTMPPRQRVAPSLQAGPPPQDDAAAAALLRYVEATEIRPAPDAVRRVGRRISAEPTMSPPRRFLAAVRALDVHGAWRAWCWTLASALGSAPASAGVRLRAVAVVVVTFMVLGGGTAAGLTGVRLLGSAISEGFMAPASPGRDEGLMPAPTSVSGAQPTATGRDPERLIPARTHGGEGAGIPQPAESRPSDRRGESGSPTPIDIDDREGGNEGGGDGRDARPGHRGPKGPDGPKGPKDPPNGQAPDRPKDPPNGPKDPPKGPTNPPSGRGQAEDRPDGPEDPPGGRRQVGDRSGDGSGPTRQQVRGEAQRADADVEPGSRRPRR